MDTTHYATHFFDCDGVLLDSNQIKTEAFRAIGNRFGAEQAESLVNYHVKNGGISRYAKVDYLLDMVDADASTREKQRAELLDHYAAFVQAGLAECAVAPGLQQLRKQWANSTWLVVSGSDQAELREVLALRGIADLFDGGIYGSPTPKETLVHDALHKRGCSKPAVLWGDSAYDHRCAEAHSLDFGYVAAWSEWEPGPELERRFTYSVQSLAELCNET